MNSHSSKKRPREVSNVHTGLIEIYEDLASENGEVRLKAAMRLLSAKYSDAELDKILNRLFRGLCSGRKAARLGFSIALTEFLARYAGTGGYFGHDTVLETLESQTNPAPGASGQELRDYYFGRLFAAEAFTKSKVLDASQDPQLWSTLVRLVLDLYDKKSWLREECGWVLYQMLLGLKGRPALRHATSAMFEQLQARKHLKSLESIALWVTCRSDGFEDARSPKDVFQNDDPLDQEEYQTLLAALKGTTTASNEGDEPTTQKAGTTWSNKLHFAWILIFEASKTVPANVANGSKGKKVTQDRYIKLWNDFVNEYLFSNSASEQRKYWGFLMVQHFIRDRPPGTTLLSVNFLRCFSNQLSKPDRHLHGIAVKTMKAIHAAADADKTGHFVGTFLNDGEPECYYVDFDKMTKTKFIEKLAVIASPLEMDETIMTLASAMIMIPDYVDRPPALWRTAAADFLLTVVKSFKTPKQLDPSESRQRLEILERILEILAHFAYSRVIMGISEDEEPKPEVDHSTREIFRSRLLSALSHLMTQTDDPSAMPAIAAGYLLEIQDEDQIPPISKSPAIVFKTIKRAGRRMTKLNKKLSKETSTVELSTEYKVHQAFRLLFAMSIIQAFSGDADAVGVLEELIAANDNLGSGEETESFASVVDIVLSLTAKPSALFRRVGKEVFSSCATLMDSNSLQPLFEVLAKQENLAGQQELFDTVDSDEDDADGSDSDVEEVNGASDVEDEGSSTEADDGEDDAELIDFENKLAEALGTHRGDADLDGVEDDTSDEDLMDDDQMAALDPLMSNMFKQRKQISSKKENKTAKETIVTFKNKVLELLEIFVRQTVNQGTGIENSPIVLLQCLECMRDTKAKQVAEKAAAVIKTAQNLYKLSTEPQENKRAIRLAKKTLHSTHDLIGHPGSNAYQRACSQVSLFCAKIILNNGGSIERIWKEYSKTGELMATSDDCKVVSVLFQDWFNWLSNGKQLILRKRRPDDAQTAAR